MPHPPRWLRSLGNTQNGVFAVDVNHRILTWNKAAADLLGHRSSAVVGRRCHEVLGGRLRSGERFCRAKCAVQRCVQREAWVQDFDLLATTATGQESWLSVSTTAVAVKAEPVIVHMIRPASRRERSEDTLDEIVASLQAYLSETQSDPLGEKAPTRQAVTRAPANGLSTLTRRELEVLDLLTRGHSAQEIARQLSLSLLTIRSHIRNMLRKTGLHRQAEIVSLALRNKLS